MSYEQRHVLRPEHFTVAPQLLGLPLARPSRRLFALLIDLVVVAVLVRVAGSIALGAVAAWAFFRFASRAKVLNPAPGRSTGRKRMWLLRAVGAFILFLVVKESWSRARAATSSLAVMAGGAAMQNASPEAKGGVQAVTGVVALQTARTREQARTAAARIVTGMRQAGASDADIRQALLDSGGENAQPWMRQVIDEAVPAAVPPPPAPAESLAAWHAAALARRDTAAVDSLRPRLASALARDSLDLLSERVSELQHDRGELRVRLEQSENRGLLRTIFQTLDELGIGFGWTGLYFTVLTTLWKGQTVGKRLMGVRVVRLNGEPMTLWMSFERFGGYAAGLVTGLLGFAQVFWDRNRQAIHDKITETVVVREAPLTPAPVVPEPPAARPRYRAPG